MNVGNSIAVGLLGTGVIVFAIGSTQPPCDGWLCLFNATQRKGVIIAATSIPVFIGSSIAYLVKKIAYHKMITNAKGSIIFLDEPKYSFNIYNEI